jgi:negative regulator of sigma E activity
MTSGRCAIVWSLALGVLLTTGAHAQQAQGLLGKVHRARQTTTLQGTLQTRVLVGGKMVTSEAGVHRGPGILIISYRTGQFKGWRMIEQDGRTWHLNPAGEARPGARGGDFMSLPPVPPNLKLGITAQGTDTVAGRKVNLYEVRPPGGSQARMLLALDTANDYPLRMERYSSEGKLISSTTFTSVNFNVSPPAKLPVPEVATAPSGPAHHHPARPASVEEIERALGGELLTPGYLPQGFSRQGTFLRPLPHGAVAEVRYGDGLRTLTQVQMRPPKGQGTGRGRGAGNKPGAGPSPLRGHMVRVQRGNYLVIIAGDLPQAELQKVADSIK